MFGLFKKKSKVEKLQEQYEKLQKEAYELSKVDRRKSDAKIAEAEKILEEMNSLID
jgi:hypothetical protein